MNVNFQQCNLFFGHLFIVTLISCFDFPKKLVILSNRVLALKWDFVLAFQTIYFRKALNTQEIGSIKKNL